MIRGMAVLALGAMWATCAVADPVPADVQSLNAAVFIDQPPAPQASSLSTALPLQASFQPLTGAPQGLRPGAATTVTIWSAKGLRGRLQAMGVKDGDKVYGGQGRFYLFAAVHGEAVGYNLQGGGGMSRGWSTDATSTLVGDGQVGVGWRKGGFEADMGYIHRSVHLLHAPLGGTDGYADETAAVSFTLRPRW